VTGAATLRSTLAPLPTSIGANTGFGFNPVADRLRLHIGSVANVRANVETGGAIVDTALAYAAGDVNFGRSPVVVATAYTNSVSPAPASTELFAIDVAQDALVKLDAPNGGRLGTVGRLVVDNSEAVGFDIPGRATDRFGYATFTPPRFTRSFLYRVNLDNADRQPVGPVGHDRPIISLAIDDRDPLPARYVIPGAAVFPEGVAYDVVENALYVGSTTDGTIYRASLRDSVAAVFLPGGGGDGRTTAVGLKVDGRSSRLYVAGGATGSVFVYDTRTRALLATLTRGTATGATFVNDVALTPSGDAYATDSQDPVIYRIATGATGTTAIERWLPLAGTAITYTTGNNLNGIVATADGRYLLAVQSNTGRLYRVTVADKSVTQVALGSASLTAGDGLLLEGRVLYVMRNQLRELVKLQLNEDYSAATVVGTSTDASFLFPTTIARADDRLLVVNAQFNQRGPGLTPTLPFSVSSVPIP
jgi:Cu-Zn family superoxide dismutase